MSATPLFALPSGLEMTACSSQEGKVCVFLLSTQSTSACPMCDGAATRIHSRNSRRLTDLPSRGQPVSIRLSVRKFFCDEPTCPRKIFAEQLAPFVAPRARVTARLFQLVQIIGRAPGGRLGKRVTDHRGIPTSRMTILRRIMALPTEPVGQITELGIDDFAGTAWTDLRHASS
jgi:transposase